MIDLFLKHSARTFSYKADDTFTSDDKLYEFGDFINSGGNAAVYKCYDATSGDELAIKIQLNTKNDRLKRFNREISATSSCAHEHLIGYRGQGGLESEKFIYGKSKGKVTLPFILMDLGDKNLSHHLKESRELSKNIKYEEYIAQFRGLANALAELHQIAVHRDIKPSNILISGDKWILSDYGLCAFHDGGEDDELTRFDEVMGPQNWMSPEANTKFCGYPDDITMASDVYQLAAVFWLVVNNRHPSGVLTKDDWCGPENIFQPLFEALQHNPHRRPNNGREFADAVIASI